VNDVALAVSEVDTTNRPCLDPGIEDADASELRQLEASLRHVISEVVTVRQRVWAGYHSGSAPTDGPEEELGKLLAQAQAEQDWRDTNPGWRRTKCETCGERKVCEDLYHDLGAGSSYPGDNADMAAAEYTGPRFECPACQEEEQAANHREQAAMQAKASQPEIVCVGWDGVSQPMYRYRSDMHLPDSERRNVAPEHHPGGKATVVRCGHCGETMQVGCNRAEVYNPGDPETSLTVHEACASELLASGWEIA
jgi:hypothetical protein